MAQGDRTPSTPFSLIGPAVCTWIGLVREQNATSGACCRFHSWQMTGKLPEVESRPLPYVLTHAFSTSPRRGQRRPQDGHLVPGFSCAGLLHTAPCFGEWETPQGAGTTHRTISPPQAQHILVFLWTSLNKIQVQRQNNEEPQDI